MPNKPNLVTIAQRLLAMLAHLDQELVKARWKEPEAALAIAVCAMKPDRSGHNLGLITSPDFIPDLRALCQEVVKPEESLQAGMPLTVKQFTARMFKALEEECDPLRHSALATRDGEVMSHCPICGWLL